MKVLEYLNNLCKQGASSYTALGILEENYSIKYKLWEDLVCLNYCQINSPKFDAITTECRSLVLGHRCSNDGGEEFYIVSRSFDRFFNEGEDSNEEYDITELTAYEKVDGSLIGVFNHKGKWLYRTRSMIMPDSDMYVNGSNLTWKDLIESQIEPCDYFMIKNCTYIFEIVSPENRVVTRYPERSAYLLQIRNNISGNYSFYQYNNDIALMGGWRVPKQYKFDTIENCIQASKDLRNLEEGYVLYDQYGKPCIKVKNPAYVAAHHLRGEGQLSSKRIMDLIFMNEQDEYLSIFSEDSYRFEPYNQALLLAEDVFNDLSYKFIDIDNQKDFALKVKDSKVAGLLFMKRKNKRLTFNDCFNRMTTPAKYRLVESYLLKNKLY